MRNLIPLGLFMICNCASAAVDESEIPLSVQIEQIRKTEQVPALAALLLKGGKVVSAVAVGVRKLGDPTLVSIGDDFHLGSDTKAMTATLAAMFIDEGKLSWTSTLIDLFPEIANMNSAFKSVTVEMLLAHRSGLTEDLIHFNGGNLWLKLQSPALGPVARKPGMDGDIFGRAHRTDSITAKLPPGSGLAGEKFRAR